MRLLDGFDQSGNSIPNNVNGFSSNEAGTRQQYAWASPREASAAVPGQQPGGQRRATPPAIGMVRDYPETGQDSWRAANDQIFINAAKKYNEKYGLFPNHPGYITPEFLKSWAMIESGGTKSAFLTDPFQVNAGDWDDKKRTLAGISGPNEIMTPQKSADSALEWLRYKSTRRDGLGVPTWLGLEQGLKRYNMSDAFHDNLERMWRLDYHPGTIHYDWYATAIMLRTADLLRRRVGNP